MTDEIADRGRLIDTAAAAEMLALSSGTLENWRVHGEGPPFIKIGRAVRYRLSDLDAWIERRRLLPVPRSKI